MVLLVLFWILWILWGLGLFVPLADGWGRAHNGIGWVLIGILGLKVLGSFL